MRIIYAILSMVRYIVYTLSGRRNRVDLSAAAFMQILFTIGTLDPEQGGALGMDETGVITHFFYDYTAARTSATYTPDTHLVTQVINDWKAENVRFCGMIHSHPGLTVPSFGDMKYAAQILKAMPETLQGTMQMPIINVHPENHTVSVHWYIVRDGRFWLRRSRAKVYVEGKRIRGPVLTPHYYPHANVSAAVQDVS